MRGAIIGDIAGSTHEFANRVSSKEFELFPFGSTFTDDTVLTIAVYDSLKNLRNIYLRIWKLNL